METTEWLILLIPFIMGYIVIGLVLFGALYGIDIWNEEQGNSPSSLLSKIMWATFWPITVPIIIGLFLVSILMPSKNDNKQE